MLKKKDNNSNIVKDFTLLAYLAERDFGNQIHAESV